jgi:hypothetical protein
VSANSQTHHPCISVVQASSRAGLAPVLGAHCSGHSTHSRLCIGRLQLDVRGYSFSHGRTTGRLYRVLLSAREASDADRVWDYQNAHQASQRSKWSGQSRGLVLHQGINYCAASLCRCLSRRRATRAKVASFFHVFQMRRTYVQQSAPRRIHLHITPYISRQGGQNSLGVGGSV